MKFIKNFFKELLEELKLIFEFIVDTLKFLSDYFDIPLLIKKIKRFIHIVMAVFFLNEDKDTAEALFWRIYFIYVTQCMISFMLGVILGLSL